MFEASNEGFVILETIDGPYKGCRVEEEADAAGVILTLNEGPVMYERKGSSNKLQFVGRVKSGKAA